MDQWAALLFSVLSLGVVAFQLALVAGAPWGEYTLGGRWPGRLPVHVRLISLLSGVVVCLMAAVVLARAGLAFRVIQSSAVPWVWGVVGYCALGSIANAATPSRRERALWLPVVLCLLGLSLVVALG